MSTNFYIKRPANIEAPAAVEHIGKRSMGWTFSFNATNFKTLAAWRQRLDNLGALETIADEYGETYTPTEFWSLVYAQRAPFNGQAPSITTNDKTIEEGGFALCNYEFC